MPHIHTQYDFAVTIFIVHDNKILFVNHPKYGKWLPIGGHIELDEDPEMAVYREVKEETGLSVTLLSERSTIDAGDVKILPTPAFVDVHPANLPHRHIGFVYFAKATTSESTKSAEHTDMRWLSLAEIDDPAYGLDVSIRFYAKEALLLVSRN